MGSKAFCQLTIPVQRMPENPVWTSSAGWRTTIREINLPPVTDVGETTVQSMAVDPLLVCKKKALGQQFTGYCQRLSGKRPGQRSS